MARCAVCGAQQRDVDNRSDQDRSQHEGDRTSREIWTLTEALDAIRGILFIL
jgi:hypothetical protein